MYLEDWIVWGILVVWLVVLPIGIWVVAGRYLRKRKKKYYESNRHNPSSKRGPNNRRYG